MFGASHNLITTVDPWSRGGLHGSASPLTEAWRVSAQPISLVDSGAPAGAADGGESTTTRERNRERAADEQLSATSLAYTMRIS